MTLNMVNANLGYRPGRFYRARHTGLHSPAAVLRHHSTTPASAAAGSAEKPLIMLERPPRLLSGWVETVTGAAAPSPTWPAGTSTAARSPAGASTPPASRRSPGSLSR
jgi:hypothetical protein